MLTKLVSSSLFHLFVDLHLVVWLPLLTRKKNSQNFLHYISTFSRGYWCASKLQWYAALQRNYFIDYVSTVQTFSKLFAGRNSFDLVNISGHSFTGMCGSFTSSYRKAGPQLLKSCRSSNSWWTVDSVEQKFLLLLLNSVAKFSAEVAQSILAFVQNLSEYFWKGDIAKQPLLGAAAVAVSDAGYLAVLFGGFVQALVTVHM